VVASLFIEVPNEPPFEVRLDQDSVSVGRSEENVLGLRDMNVSRKHFIVERRPGIGHVLRDNGSRNGTIVNGVSVLDKVLQEGDRIDVGGSHLTFKAVASPSSISLGEAPRPTSTRKSGVSTLPPGAIPGGSSPLATSGSGLFPTAVPGNTARRAATFPTSPTVPLGSVSSVGDRIAPIANVDRANVDRANVDRAMDPLHGLGGDFGATPGPARGTTTWGLEPARVTDPPRPTPTPGSTPAPGVASREPPTNPAGVSRGGAVTTPQATPRSTPAVSGGPSTAAHPGAATPRADGGDVASPSGVVTSDGEVEVGETSGIIGRNRWQTLAQVACAVNQEHDIDKLLERILDAVLSLVPSKSGFLVLREGEALAIKVRRNAPHATLEGETARLSLGICREAISQRRPVLTQDAIGDERLGQFQTVMALRLKSILCVPISTREEVLGVVYLDEPMVDPFAENGEVVELVGAFGDLAGIALSNARLLLEIAGRERLEEEVRLAQRIQQNLLPKAPPAGRGVQLAGKTRAARLIGGDTFDYFRREQPEPEVLVSIGDVAGKGVAAGLVMSNVRALLHAYAEAQRTTSEIVVCMNRALAAVLEPGTFVSFLLIRYHEESGRLSYTGAGHEHLVFYRPSTGQLELVRAGGVVLGLMAELGDRVTERHLTLQPGDLVVLYTDGATEAPNAAGEEFGLERLTKLIREGSSEPEAVVDRVMAAVDAFGGGGELHDDLTVVALKKL
jgi:serine phosphatase RsbU (regulator of sigma subunit)